MKNKAHTLAKINLLTSPLGEPEEMGAKEEGTR